MGEPREVARPYAPPDGSDPAARDTARVTPPPQRGDRVALHLRLDHAVSRPRRRRGRLIERIGTVGVVHGNGTVTVVLDDATGPRTMRTVPATEIYPRPGR